MRGSVGRLKRNLASFAVDHTSKTSMRINQSTVLVGQAAVLVPYRKEHVEKYHRWMSDPQIRQQTASEPLSIEEEYEMQKSWHLDEDKLTFIVLGKGAVNDTADVEVFLSSCSMAGDVNLFISERHEDDDIEEGPKRYDGELEVMIAESSQRRRGLAKEALGMLMYYATKPTMATDELSPTSMYLPLTPDAFVAKIGIDNSPSIALFAKLGFVEVKRSEIWKEAELRPERRDTVHMQEPLQVLDWPLTDNGT